MLSLLLFCIVLKVLTSAVREEKVRTQIEKERNKAAIYIRIEKEVAIHSNILA